ncbi:MAG: cytidine deaminase [Gammaproteobacteria bacterium]|nr:cytidine deaminase [Gammaproteobacteria bacterium]
MKSLINNFPNEVRSDLSSLIDNGGVLRAEKCEHICQLLSISIENLMVKLLPLAASYSKSELSSYKVGAVAQGIDTKGNGISDLYFGANLEFSSLYNSLHAEQAAVSNAWLDGQKGIRSIAVSGAPCGHCRQFLKEVAGNNDLQIILPADSASEIFLPGENPEDNVATIDLSKLLPAAFGPLDLGCEQLMMEATEEGHQLELTRQSDSYLVLQALLAANRSYAPYSSNYAGCALEMKTGEIFCGQYAENAAHNPSLSPYSSALSKMILSMPEFDYDDIARLVLVESPTMVSQKSITTTLLLACNKDVELEYFAADVKS